MTDGFDGWAEVEARVAAIVAERPADFDPDTIANARSLIAFLRPRYAPPDVHPGYWPTFQFEWSDALSLEVFADRIEVYPPTPSGRPIDVWTEPHRPDDAYSHVFQTEIGRRVPARVRDP